jgi:hypothetical protein
MLGMACWAIFSEARLLEDLHSTFGVILKSNFSGIIP